MTPERAAELLPIIKAFSEGKAIQRQSNGQWMDLGKDVDFEYLPHTYRVRPNILRFKMAICPHQGYFILWEDEEPGPNQEVLDKTWRELRT